MQVKTDGPDGALWQGVLAFDRTIRGFKLYCCIDHKNNLFSEAQLDNGRRSQKMANWALDLQRYDLVCVWIRGEADSLGDALSRAPWETELAQHVVSIAEGLVCQAMFSMALLPCVWRSDNAKEFWSEIMREMTRLLGARHIGSSTCHPQSQGAVAVVKGLVQEHPT